MNNRILDNDDYSHSKITNVVQDDKIALKNVLLDLTDSVFVAAKELQELEKLIELKTNEIKIIHSGIKTAVIYGIRNFDFAESPLILHDKEQKTIRISVSGHKVEVIEHFLEVFD